MTLTAANMTLTGCDCDNCLSDESFHLARATLPGGATRSDLPSLPGPAASLGTAPPSSMPVPAVGTIAASDAPVVPAETSLTPRLRDSAREARTIPAARSALGHGLILEVKRLRTLLVANGIDPDGEVIA